MPMYTIICCPPCHNYNRLTALFLINMAIGVITRYRTVKSQRILCLHPKHIDDIKAEVQQYRVEQVVMPFQKNVHQHGD